MPSGVLLRPLHAERDIAAAGPSSDTTSTSLVRNALGYLPGLSSPSVVLSRITRRCSPRSCDAGQIRLPTSSMNRKVELAFVQFLEGSLDQRDFEVARAAGGDLDRRRVGRQPLGVAVGLDVADQHAHLVRSPASRWRVASSSVVLPEPGEESSRTTSVP